MKWSKQAERQCLQPAVTGFDCCYIHGGKSKTGVDNPNFKNGASANPPQKYQRNGNNRYRNVAKTKWAKAYEEYTQDSDSLSLVDDIALNHARIEEAIESIDTVVTPEAAKILNDLLTEAITAFNQKDGNQVGAKLSEMRDCLRTVKKTQAAEKRLDTLINQRVRLVHRQNEFVKDEHSMMASSAVMKLMFGLWSDVKKAIASAVDETLAMKLFAIIEYQMDLRIMYMTGQQLNGHTIIEGEAE